MCILRLNIVAGVLARGRETQSPSFVEGIVETEMTGTC